MRFMTMVRAAENQGAPPEALMHAIAKGSEESARAGTLIDTGGLAPSAIGTRVRVSGGKLSVTDGPFAEAKEVVGGYAVLQVNSKEEAIEWLKRAPFDETEVEIRQVFEADDFGAEFTPELREQEARLLAQVAAKK